MALWINSLIEGRLETSGLASDEIAEATLENVLEHHLAAGRTVRPIDRDGDVVFEVLDEDSHLHATHWLSYGNEGQRR